jgi:hypothetical protein
METELILCEIIPLLIKLSKSTLLVLTGWVAGAIYKFRPFLEVCKDWNLILSLYG